MLCMIEGCDRWKVANQMCGTHYDRWRKNPDDLEALHAPINDYGFRRQCEVSGCERKHHSKGLCHTHYIRQRSTGTTDLQPRPKAEPIPCKVDGCGNVKKSLGLCAEHLNRPTCSTEGCKKDSVALHGLCRVHRAIQQGTAKRCTVTFDSEECQRPLQAKGLCSLHYAQMKAHERIISLEPEPGRALAGLDSEARFAARLEADGDCWLWTGPTDDDGYGHFSDGGKNQLAHRWAWKQFVNPSLPPSMTLDHICQRPACVRPGHLQEAAPSRHSTITHMRRAMSKAEPESEWVADSRHRNLSELFFGLKHVLPTALHSRA